MSSCNQSPIKLMVTIVDRDKAEFVVKICNDLKLHYHVGILGEGTATGEILDYFGLATTDKAIIVSLVAQSLVDQTRIALRNELQLNRRGHGILFTIPVSAISKMTASKLTANLSPSETEVKEMETAHYDLILAIVNQGHSDEAMDAAKSAGAGGGTLLHARKIGSEHEEEFFGISIKQEKEIVSILTTCEKKCDIMKALMHTVGFNTPAHGMILSLPVEAVEGIALD